MLGAVLRLALVVASGLLLSLAFEPVAWFAVLPLAVAGFFLAVHGRRARAGFGLGLAFGASFYLTHIWWMRAVAVPAWLGLSALETFFYGMFFMLYFTSTWLMALRHRRLESGLQSSAPSWRPLCKTPLFWVGNLLFVLLTAVRTTRA